MRLLATVFILVVALSNPSFAQLSWQQTNGPYAATGGQIQSISHFNWTGLVFCGTFGGGISRSTDAGKTWTPCNNGLSDLEVHCVFCGTDWVSHDLYVGTYNGGAFRSVDSGAHWTQINNGIGSTNVMCFCEDGRGGIYAGTWQGVAYSSNKGDTWSAVSGSNITNTVQAISTTDSGYVLIGNGDGVSRSTDQGVHWTKVSSFYPSNVGSLICDPFHSVYYAGVENGNGVYKSTNNGVNWVSVSSGLKNNEVVSLAVDDSTDYLIAGTRASGNGGVFMSKNGGTTWSATSIVNYDVYAVGTGAQGVFYAGIPSGVQRSSDTGATWTQTPMQGANVIGLAATGSGEAFACVDGVGLFHTNDQGAAWSKQIDFGDSNVTVAYIDRYGRAFIGGDGIGVSRSSDHGATWTRCGLIPQSIYSITQGRDNAIYAGAYGYGISKSTDGGSSWTTVKSGLTNSFVNAMCVDSNGKIFAGTDNSGMISSSDGGATWITSSSGLSGAIKAVVATPGGQVCAATSGGLYVTLNSGTNWSRVSTVASGAFTSVAANSSGSVFAGSKTGGVYSSQDNCATWKVDTTGLTSPAVTTLALDGDGFLYAGTGSSGVYRTSATTNAASTGPSAPILLTATPGNDSVTVVWQKNPESNIKQYFVYIGTDSTQASVVDSTSDTTAIVTSVVNDTTYYCYVTVVDKNGNVSKASNIIAVIPTAGAIGQYGSDNQTEALFHGDPENSDGSGHGNNGVAHGTTLVNGRFGKAWKFAGNGEYVEVANAPALNPTQGFTAEMWFMQTGGNGKQNLLVKGVPGVSVQYGLSLNVSFVAWTTINGSQVHATGKTTVVPNQWFHVAAEYNGTALILYVNGVEDGRTNASGNLLATAGPLNIGSPASLGSLFVTGLIDEVRISNVARTPQQLNLFLPSSVTQTATLDQEPNIKLHGVVNPHGLPTSVYFEWDTTPGLSNPTQTQSQFAGVLNADTTITALIAAFTPHTYFYRLVAVTTVGTVQGNIMQYSTTAGVNDASSSPASLTLEQNYPNPFTTTTEFRVAISAQQQEHASLNVYDIYGRAVANLTDQLRANPERVKFDAENLPAGMYWCVVETGISRTSRRMVVVK